MQKTIKINKIEYFNLSQVSRLIKGEDGPKKLDSNVLWMVLNKKLTALENQPVKFRKFEFLID